MNLLPIDLSLLEELQGQYPKCVLVGEMKATERYGASAVNSALHLLLEAKKIEAIIDDSFDHPAPLIQYAKITLDGVTSLRGEESYLTIKIHNETMAEFRAVFLDAISQMPAPEEQKSVMRKAIESAPSSVITEVSRTMARAAMEKGPQLADQLYKLLCPPS